MSSPDPTDRSPVGCATGVASDTCASTLEPALYLHEYTSAGVSVRGIVALLDLPGAAGRGPPARGRARRPGGASSPTGCARCRSTRPRSCSCTAARSRSATLLDEVDRGRPPDLVYTDRGDQLQRIWRITDPDVQATLDDALADARAVIADGHHRYAAAAGSRPQRPGTGWDQTLVMLIDQADTPLQLVRDPPHRSPADAEQGRGRSAASAATTSAGTPAATRRWPSSRTRSSCTTVSTGPRCDPSAPSPLLV